MREKKHHITPKLWYNTCMLSKLFKYIKHPSYFLLWLDYQRAITLNDDHFLRLAYRKRFGKDLDPENPKTFNEKLQWLKINDRNPEYVKMVDKNAVKQYIAERVGEQYIIPTLGIYDSFGDIDFDKLPNKFVIKCTHDSGSVVIVKDKTQLNIAEARKNVNKSLKTNFYYSAREWPYKEVKPKIIIEKYIETENGDLNDYKFFVFNGKARYIQVDYGRFTKHERNIYSIDWEYQPFSIQYPTNPQHVIKKPKNLKEMITLAEKIAAEIGSPSFVRVDLYNIDGQIKFGELTFYHGAGFEVFKPERYERIFGDLIKLPMVVTKNEK